MVEALNQPKKYLTQGNKECNSFRGFSQNFRLRVIQGPSAGKKDVSFLGVSLTARLVFLSCGC